MSTLDLAATMRALATALLTAKVVEHAYPYPIEGAEQNAAVVGYPAVIEYGRTFSQAPQDATLPVWIVGGLVFEEATLDEVSAFLATDAQTVKDTLEGDIGLGDVSVLVTRISIESMVTNNDLRHIAVRFDVEVKA